MLQKTTTTITSCLKVTRCETMGAFTPPLDCKATTGWAIQLLDGYYCQGARNFLKVRLWTSYFITVEVTETNQQQLPITNHLLHDKIETNAISLGQDRKQSLPLYHARNWMEMTSRKEYACDIWLLGTLTVWREDCHTDEVEKELPPFCTDFQQTIVSLLQINKHYVFVVLGVPST